MTDRNGKLRFTRETFLAKDNALDELVKDAQDAGLTVEHDTRRNARYRIEGILVYETGLYTVGFGRVRKLIANRMVEERRCGKTGLIGSTSGRILLKKLKEDKK